MGTSTVSYGERSFEAPDPVLDIWLRLLVDAIDARPTNPSWLLAARDDWQLLATQEFGFGSAPDLDALLTTPEQRRLVGELAQTALARLQTWGDPVPAATLNRLGAGKPGHEFPRDLPARLFLDVAHSFIQLVAVPGADAHPRGTGDKP